MNRKVTDEDRAASARLKKLFRETKHDHGMIYDDLAYKVGITASGLSHYMNGRNALNIEILLKLCSHIPTAKAHEIYPSLFEDISSDNDDPHNVAEKFYALDEDMQRAILVMLERYDSQ